MKKVATLLLLIALIALGNVYTADAASTYCPPDCLPLVFDAATGCDWPSTASQIAARCGLSLSVVNSCLKNLKDRQQVWLMAGGKFCRGTG